jgi:hypothetical protein
VCPACGRAKGVEAERKTATCQCGRKITLSRVNIQLQTDSQRELVDAVAQANSLLASGERWPDRPRRKGRKGTYAEVARQVESVRDPVGRLTKMAEQLGTLKGDFGVDDIRKVLAHMDGGSADETLARMQELGLVYMTADGLYRLV